MTSISAYSFIGFITGMNINAAIGDGQVVPIPDLIRYGLNVYWNKGKFIGAGELADEGFYTQVNLSTIQHVSALSKIEKITFRPNVKSDRWKDQVGG